MTAVIAYISFDIEGRPLGYDAYKACHCRAEQAMSWYEVGEHPPAVLTRRRTQHQPHSAEHSLQSLDRWCVGVVTMVEHCRVWCATDQTWAELKKLCQDTRHCFSYKKIKNKIWKSRRKWNNRFTRTKCSFADQSDYVGHHSLLYLKWFLRKMVFNTT